jgi:uncharacterized membrane protein YphA (DoxX/SURF4 family)
VNQDIVHLIVLILRAFLAAILVTSGAAKMADRQGFATTLMTLGLSIRPVYLVLGLSVAIPLLEIGIGVFLVSGFWPSMLNIAVLVLMGSFTLITIFALRKKLSVACRCFGALSDSQFNRKGLVRSLLLTGSALLVFWGGNTYSLGFDGSPSSIILLVAGYLILAGVAAQAAKTIAMLKARLPS